ncbi:MAG: hypothetical protein ACYC5N_04920, partial [Endomicrobiales bacterium]
AEFLERIGWQDEEPDGGKEEKKNEAAAERKARKKLKAEFLQERYQALTPLEGRIKELETAITRSEEELHHTTTGLVKASTEGDAPAIAGLSRRHHELRPRIDSLYEELEEALTEYEKQCEHFKQRLAGFE